MVRQCKILGHIVSKNGISTDEDKIQAIAKVPKPTNAKEVHRFMGHCGGYDHQFIFRFAIIAQPLYTLIVAFEWTDECDVAFEKLKEALTNASILRALD